MGVTEQFRVINAVRTMNEQYGIWVGTHNTMDDIVAGFTPHDFLYQEEPIRTPQDYAVEKAYLEQFYTEDMACMILRDVEENRISQ